jgi:peptidoglycan/LPS O-acetylase OafA/YrhL
LTKSRDPYLDLLRALAIVMVLIHHVAQMLPVPQYWLMAYTHYGAFGVDLFFVLSGWLIGGLFWR